MYVFILEGGYRDRWNAATDAAFHKDVIGLDTDATVKLNCDEAEESKYEATLKRVRKESRGDNQGHGQC